MKNGMRWTLCLCALAVSVSLAFAETSGAASSDSGGAGGGIGSYLKYLWPWTKTEQPSASPEQQDSLPAFPAYLTSSWEALSSTLTEALDLRDKQEALPDSAFFGTDKSSNAKKIGALLDRAVEILLQGDTDNLRRQALALRESIPALQVKANGLRNSRISAPESSKLPWVATRAKIDENLAKLNAEIKEKEQALADINGKIAGELRKIGLDLDERQVDVLLTSVTGDDIFQNTVVFANIRHVVEKLAELSREDGDNLEIARRYTGMYLVLNDILIVTQEGLIEKIETDYKPRLALVRAEAEKLREEAAGRAKQGQYTESQRKTLEANARANALTVRVAGLYADLLESQRRSVLATLSDLRRGRDVAENTYKTVKSTGDLRNLIRSGLDLFDSIQALSMPQIQPFESEAIRKEFEEINKRLKTGAQ
jgi:hypothetical protein